jgi:uncharacterized protein YcbX
MKTVTQLYIYPIKSLGGIELGQAKVTVRGLEHDRRWMLVDESGTFLTQRTFPKMSLLRTALADDRLEVYVRGNDADRIRLRLHPEQGEECKVRVWDDTCDALRVSDEADAWFSEKLERQVCLVYMPDTSLRPVDPRYAVGESITSFSDGYPILMIGQASLDDLNARLDVPVDMDRFRPNIVFSGGAPYEEDDVRRFRIGDVLFHGVKPCARCVMTTIDQDSGNAGREPLATLSRYRTVDQKVMFGQNVIGGPGLIRVGMPVEGY